MIPNEPNPIRTLALSHLDWFADHVLPGILRRIVSWKRLPIRELPDLLLELRQELAVDSLEHGDRIVAMPQEERHKRWMRLAERWVYRNRVLVTSRGHNEPDRVAAPPAPVPAAEVHEDPPLEVVALANGRCNVAASARRNGRRPGTLRRELDEIGDRLSGGGERAAFWQERLGEAMTGLAADLLRQRGGLHLLPTSHRDPDPRARLRRLRRLRAKFHIRATTLPIRRVLQKWVRRPRFHSDSPRRLLEQVTELCPGQPAGWLWLVEACLQEGDLRAAASHLRSCRTFTAPPPRAVVLARARLLEMRGRLTAALGLLRRARRRWPRDARLRLAAARAGAERSRHPARG